MDAVIRFLRERPGARKALSIVSALLLLGALGLLGYPVYTNLQHDRLQGRLGDELASPELKQAYQSRKVPVGDALTRLKIPALGVDTVVVEGITPSALRAGAGHYPGTPLPCEAGNVSIAGHRTTFGRPFADVDRLKVGDVITLETPVGGCTYEVQAAAAPFRAEPGMPAAFVVAPNDFRVIDQDPAVAELTLTTCHPRGSAAKRLIIRAKRVAASAVRG